MKYLSLLALALSVTACAQPGELSGYIGPDMVKKANAELAQGQRAFTINRSNGGEVFAANILAAHLNEAGASLTVNGYCASACVILYKATRNHALIGQASLWEHEPYLRYQSGPASNLRRTDR